MAIAFSNLGASASPDLNDNTDTTSYSNSSWTPPASGLILVFVHARGSSAGAAVAPSVSGNSLTWTQIASDVRGSDRLTLFAANASGSATGATVFDFGSDGQLNCTAAFMQATGVDMSGGVAACFVQAVTAQSNTVTGEITLSAAADAAHRAVAGWWRGANESVTPRTNWDEYDELNGTGPVRVVETQARSDAFETTASATWGSAGAWIGIAAELKIAASGIAGTASVTLGAATASATGQLPIAGTASPALADATLTAAGAAALRGLVSATLGAAAVLSTGQLPIAGAAAATLGDATLSAAGVVVSGAAGALSATLDNAALTAATRLGNDGALVGVLGDVVLAATGLLAEGVGGSLVVSLANATLTAAGATAIVGTASIVLDHGQLTAAGAAAIAGATAVYLADATLTAVGVEIVIRQIVLGAVRGTRRRGGVASMSRRGMTTGVGSTGTAWG